MRARNKQALFFFCQKLLFFTTRDARGKNMVCYEEKVQCLPICKKQAVNQQQIGQTLRLLFVYIYGPLVHW